MGEQNQRALLLRSIVSRFEQRVNEFLDYAQSHPEASFPELEAQARRVSRDCFAPSLAAVVESRPQAVEGEILCGCGQTAQHKGEQERSQETFVGRISWRRAYYYCKACRSGRYPLDEALQIGPGQFSEALQAGVARLGVALPFAPASETFSALTGISISARETERITEGRGAALEAHLAKERGELMNGDGKVPAVSTAKESGTWSVSLDAAKVHFEDGWHEVKAGVVFVARPESGDEAKVKAHQQSYVAHVGGMEQSGERLYAEAIRRGIDTEKERVVCLGDGAVGNWSAFGLHFPHRVEILDWYHAVEHLWAAGNGVFGQGSDDAREWVEARKGELWEGDVEALEKALAKEAQQPGGQAAADEMHYFATNRERMRYQQFRSRGYPIGSGTVESACKRVIGARMKQAGMRWSHAGAQTVLSLRAELLSGRWDRAWEATRTLRKAA